MLVLCVDTVDLSDLINASIPLNPPRSTSCSTYRLALGAFERWAHDAKARKQLASSERVMRSLVVLLGEAYERLEVEASTPGKAISSTRVMHLMALVGKVGWVGRRILPLGAPVGACVSTSCRGVTPWPDQTIDRSIE